jgi:transposase InsO family protein
MKIHANAPLGPKGRALMLARVVDEGWTLKQAAEAAGVSARTAGKWVARWRAEGQAGLVDRSSEPKTVANRTACERIEAIAALRRLRMSSAEIAECLGMARSTVSGILCHVCVDDATRLAYVQVLADEKAMSAVGFLKRAVAFYRAHGVTVQRLMTDNGGAYLSTVHAIACRALKIKHLRTRPYRPRTHGKAERFIRTMLGGWAHGAIHRSSAERQAALGRVAK